MNWQEKIKKGMELIGEGCFEVDGMNHCLRMKCPFANYCWLLEKHMDEDKDLLMPWHWDKM